MHWTLSRLQQGVFVLFVPNLAVRQSVDGEGLARFCLNALIRNVARVNSRFDIGERPYQRLPARNHRGNRATLALRNPTTDCRAKQTSECPIKDANA
jgi:hypothetical protein